MLDVKAGQLVDIHSLTAQRSPIYGDEHRLYSSIAVDYFAHMYVREPCRDSVHADEFAQFMDCKRYTGAAVKQRGAPLSRKAAS